MSFTWVSRPQSTKPREEGSGRTQLSGDERNPSTRPHTSAAVRPQTKSSGADPWKALQMEDAMRNLRKQNVDLQEQITALKRDNKLIRDRETTLSAALEKSDATQKILKEKLSRQTTVQKKPDDVERRPIEARKETSDHLKFDLDRLRKTNNELSEKLKAAKKGKEDAEHAAQEAKRILLLEQSECKDLRRKIRILESDKAELSDKKKALGAADTKRKVDARDRDGRVQELEHLLAGERKKREMLESQGNNTAALQDLKVKLDRSQLCLAECEDKVDEQAALLEAAVNRLKEVSEEYGNLASSTVSQDEHTGLKQLHYFDQLRIARLERKLANAEDQAQELAQFARHAQDQRTSAEDQFEDLWEEFEARFSYPPTSEESLVVDDETGVAHLEAILIELGRAQDDLEHHTVLSQMLLYHGQEMAQVVTAAEHGAIEASAHLENARLQLMTAEQSRNALQKELDEARRDWRNREEQCSSLTDKVTCLQRDLDTAKQQHASASAKLKREHEATNRLTSTVQQLRAAEAALAEDNRQLVDDLAEASKYQEAYTVLSDEMELLISRNALAEEETTRLSRFNAEILGHHNPTQKILYVHRLRQELADAKQTIISATRERDRMSFERDAVQHELDQYKSLPYHEKAKGTTTRVERRAPLLAKSVNVPQVSSPASPDSFVLPTKFSKSYALSGFALPADQSDIMATYIPDLSDMTLDDL